MPGSPDPDQLPLALEWEVSPGVPAIPGLPAALRVVADGPDEIWTRHTELVEAMFERHASPVELRTHRPIGDDDAPFEPL